MSSGKLNVTVNLLLTELCHCYHIEGRWWLMCKFMEEWGRTYRSYIRVYGDSINYRLQWSEADAGVDQTAGLGQNWMLMLLARRMHE